MSRTTEQVERSVLDVLTTGEHDGEAVAGAVKAGRRRIDWRAIFSVETEVSLFFYVFGCFLDEKHKPSMSRIMLAIWTFAGWRMINHELALSCVIAAGGNVCGASLQNAVWTAWWAAEGVLTLAVFGPGVASYFGPGAAGAVAATSISTALRSGREILESRGRAKDAGEEGTEYNK